MRWRSCSRWRPPPTRRTRPFVRSPSPAAPRRPPTSPASATSRCRTSPRRPRSSTSNGSEEAGARRLADLTRFDASVSDAYNAPGYWDFLAIRGFTLDNRFNYRREGLPVSAETVIPLDNKERIEILKGTSGIRAGTSAPGGLVNYVVKRPTQNDLRAATLEYTQGGGVLGAIDLGGRFGAGRCSATA
ncbi:TonB-dependent receptor plug domain-containing protein [Ramlibacter terrae]|uniref:TonB-dependent receptor plug domain-containing protein n=1 Tax=Ramlibacter terrae TaxID=2732511 RepID=A0ABX6P4C7_9BURK|nr:TonB-dependent receptor plug domain-containing protein [Ramlibacter terrae]